MLISEKKVELVLKQKHRVKWPQLCYEGGDGAVCCDGDEEGDGCFVAGDSDEEQY